MASPGGESSNRWGEPLSEEGAVELLESLEKWSDYLKHNAPALLNPRY
jgi:hypothetical protein